MQVRTPTRADGIPFVMSPNREISVAPDRFEAAADDAILLAELQSAIAVCVYDAVEEAGALLHLRCLVRSPKPVDMTDSTLATELLLLDRCVETMREMAPGARNLQARVVAHLADHPKAPETCETVLTMVRHFLADANITLLPVDVAAGPARSLRFRPSMGWLQTR
jgi:chemotaxis receptor (MCP) glutamine deamidase CheD